MLEPVVDMSAALVKPTEKGGSILVVGLDVATTTGYAYRVHDRKTGKPLSPLFLGLVDLSVGQYDSGGLRFARLRAWLKALGPDLIGFEDAKTQTPDMRGGGISVMINLKASELFGAFKATVAGWAEEYAVPAQAYHVGVIKKRATGKGNANKTQMIEACNARFGTKLDPDVDGVDNLADAAFVYHLVCEELLDGLLTGPKEDRKVETL